MYDEYDQVINQSRFQKPAPAPQAAPVEPPPSEDKFVARFESRGSDTHYGLTPPSAQERAEMAAHFNDDNDGAAAYTTPVAEPPAIAATDLDAAKPAAQSTDNLSFGAAFKQARQSGATQFTWRGNPYSTALASEKPKPATPAPKEPIPTTEQPAPAKPETAKPEAAATTASNPIIAKASTPANNSPSNIYSYNHRQANEQRMSKPAQRDRSKPFYSVERYGGKAPQ